MEESKPVVIDCGSYECRVGVAGDDDSIKSFPTVVGRPKAKVKTGSKLAFTFSAIRHKVSL